MTANDTRTTLTLTLTLPPEPGTNPRARPPDRAGELSSTLSGIDVAPLSTPESVTVDYERDLGYPGEFPYTRGVYPSMYRGRLWTMRQFAGFGSAGETNERFRYLLEHGQTGLSTAFDMPTLMGYDADHPRGRGLTLYADTRSFFGCRVLV